MADVWAKPNAINHSRWLEEDLSLRVYVRHAKHLLGGELREVIDIANVVAEPTGIGRFTRFLEWIEDVRPYEGIYIESVISPRFQEFFHKRGYTERYHSLTPDYYRLWNPDNDGD